MDEDKTITINPDKLLSFGPAVLAAVAALAFSPINIDAFDLPKTTLLLIFCGILAAAFFLKAVMAKKLEISSSVFNLPVLAFAAALLASALIPGNKVSSLTNFTLLSVPCFLVYFLLSNIVKSEQGFGRAFSGLIFSAFALAVFTIITNGYALIGRIYGLPAINLLVPTFSPTGSIFAQTVFLIIIFPLVIAKIKTKNKFIWGPILAVMTTGIILGINTLFANRPILLDYQTSWRIATGALGTSFLSALFGAGYNQFGNVFTLFKPLDFNLTALWNLRFTSSGNYYLHLLAVSGIAGLAAFLWLAARFIKTFRLRLSLNIARPEEIALLTAIGFVLASFLFIPASLISLFALFYLLGLLVTYYRLHEVTALSSYYKKDVNPKFALLAAVLISGGLIYYAVSRIFLADYLFAKSLTAAAENKGTDVYNLQIKAIDLNPTNDNYRISYSQTNLALADSMAGAATAENPLTEEQRSTIVQLVQQSIREARNAAALNPGNAATWENLTGIYRALINFAQGANDWAIASQNQAINLDPTNPRLRLDLGGLYMAMEQYNNAAQTFSMATQLKPDFANAHYNLAQAYRMLKNNDFYKQEAAAAKTLVCAVPESADCIKLTQELLDFDKEVVREEASPSAQPTNLPKAKTTPPAKISSPSGELNP